MSAREQAAKWLCDLQDADDTERAQFAAWLKASPRHVEEFLSLDAIWKEMDGVDARHEIDIGKLLDAHGAEAPPLNVIPFQPAAQHRPGPPIRPTRLERWSRAASIAALALVVTLIAYWSTPLLLGKQTFATAVGEQRAIKLSDDSVIYLNTDSRVEVHFTENARDIRLVEGEALFTVEHDPSRPFRVDAGKTVVQAVGTQFNVYKRPSGTSVAVIEGVVKILPPVPSAIRSGAVDGARQSPTSADALVQAEGERDFPAAGNAVPEAAQSSSSPTPTDAGELRLAAGQAAYIARNGAVEKQATSNVEDAIAWKQRRLVFRSDTLAEVAAEFNRYNRTKILIDGDALKARRLIGTFNADDPESLALFLDQDESLAVERSAHEIVIRAAEKQAFGGSARPAML